MELVTIKSSEERKEKYKNLYDKINSVLLNNPVEDKSYIMPDIDFSYEDLELLVLAVNRSVAIEILNISYLEEKGEKE